MQVWLAAALMGDSVLVHGGAEWTFEPGCWGNDVEGVVYMANLASRTWSTIQPVVGAHVPRMRAGAAYTMCGREFLIYGGQL